jgi:putative ABC transport system permease protein
MAETMTLSVIEWFLYIITALVTGAFFLVWTIQRSADIAVMRAVGAARGFPLRDSLGQAVAILALSIIVGVSLAVGLGLWLETTPMPFSTECQSILCGAAMLFISGLIGTFIAVYRVTRTDPLTALGENR